MSETAIKRHVGHTISDMLKANAGELQKALPKHLTLDRLLKTAIYAINRSPALQACTPASLVTCITQCAELGLELTPALGLAYLIPYGTTATLIVGYRGLLDLARRSGVLAQGEAHVIYDTDDFLVEYGLDPKLRHIPDLRKSGRPIGVYFIARLSNGERHIEVMTWEAVMKIKARSKTSGSGPWVSDEEEMAKKTVVRRAAKYLPLSPEMADALNADDEFVDADVVNSGGLQLTEGAPAPTATQKTKEKVRRISVNDQSTPDPLASAEGEVINGVSTESAPA